jgi:hypothetical protein
MNWNTPLRRRTPAGAPLALSLTGCSLLSGANAPPAKPELAIIPANLQRPCANPAIIPAGDLPAEEVVRLWLSDRASLLVCRNRHGQLVKAVVARDPIQGR